MKKRLILLLVVLFSPALLATTATGQNGEGAKVFNDNCARCHAPRAPAEQSDAGWETIMHHMHTRGYFTERERVAVLRFLQHNNRTKAPAAKKAPAAQTADARELVTRFGCKGCHIMEGGGGTIGPSLDTVFQRRDADFISKKLANPKIDNPRSVMPFFSLSEKDKELLVQHLRKIQQ